MKLTWWKKCLFAGVLTSSLAGVADAQQPGGGQGGRGGPGGGGFGGGRGGGSLLSLADNEAVQKELNVDDDAQEAIKKVNEAYREELQKAIDEATKAVHSRLTPQVKEALTAEQFKRLQQIRVQALRDQAFTDAEIVKALGLKQEQQEKIADLGKEYAEKQRGLFGGGGDGGRPDFTTMRARLDELNKEKESKINEVLTKDQQDKFKAIKGKEFDLSLLQPRGFGGAGGRPGGGTGGRPSGDGTRPKATPPVVD